VVGVVVCWNLEDLEKYQILFSTKRNNNKNIYTHGFITNKIYQKYAGFPFITVVKWGRVVRPPL